MIFIIIFMFICSTGSLFSMEKEKVASSSPSDGAMQFTVSCDSFVQKLQRLIVYDSGFSPQ